MYQEVGFFFLLKSDVSVCFLCVITLLIMVEIL